MSFIRKIFGHEKPAELPKAPRERDPEVQKTLDLVKETLGGLGETYLRLSQDRLGKSLENKVTRDSLNTLLSTVSDYRKKTEHIRTVKAAEAQFNAAILGSQDQAILNELEDLVMMRSTPILNAIADQLKIVGGDPDLAEFVMVGQRSSETLPYQFRIGITKPDMSPASAKGKEVGTDEFSIHLTLSFEGQEDKLLQFDLPWGSTLPDDLRGVTPDQMCQSLVGSVDESLSDAQVRALGAFSESVMKNIKHEVSQKLKEGFEQEIQSKHIGDLSEKGITETQQEVNQRFENLCDLFLEAYKLPEGIENVRALQGLIMSPACRDFELMDAINTYCDQLEAASAYVAQVRIDGGVVLVGLDVVENLMRETDKMQMMMNEKGIGAGGEIIRNVSSALVMNHFSGPEAERLVDLGIDPNVVKSNEKEIIDSRPLVQKLLENFPTVKDAFESLENKFDVFSKVPPLACVEFGNILREVAMRDETRELAENIFLNLIRTLDKVEGLMGGESFTKNGIGNLFTRTESDFTTFKTFDTSYGPVNVPVGLLKDFHRSSYFVDGKEYRSKTDLMAKDPKPEDVVNLTNFLEDIMNQGVSKEDLEYLLMYSFQSSFGDVIILSQPLDGLMGMVLNSSVEEVNMRNQNQYVYSVTDGQVQFEAKIRKTLTADEGVQLGWEGVVEFDFGRKEDGAIDYTKGNTRASWESISGFVERK